MLDIEKIINDTELKIQELKKVLEIVKEYPNKDLIQMAIEGRIDGYLSFLKGLKDE